ncbi:MAG: ImmA/IrrE family metallo-endopeptidase [Phycisphaeraceae bacterium]|nr:ImmA/IrrE family metallo-endopeptidase [Phycisphaeraceae bacterium]
MRTELAANALLRRCMAERGLAALPLPIPIEEWIESPLGYRFEIVSDAELGPGILGRARPSVGEIAINECLLQHEGRYRFTCAHELAHLTLHHGESGGYSDGELPRDGDASRIEREADRFAAAFLVPGDTLGDAIVRTLADDQLAPQCLEMLRGDDVIAVWLWRRCVLPRLAEVYEVSKPAMAYRCRELRLPNQRRLVRPSLVPLLTCPEAAIRVLPLSEIVVKEGVPRLAKA